MAGHSKWSNIKRKKEKTDSQRAKVFTKIGREIAIAAREGGPDPEENSSLRDIINKAKALNVPNDNIDRALKKASEKGGADYEKIIYEGYGINGVAVVVETLTDNRNRTAGEMRHYFDKYSGNLGQSGSVMFVFQQKGVIVIENTGFNEEILMEDCIEAGAENFEITAEAAEIITSPEDLNSVRNILASKGYEFALAEVDYIPNTEVELGTEDTEMMEKLIDMLEENDDVLNVWHNWKID